MIMFQTTAIMVMVIMTVMMVVIMMVVMIVIMMMVAVVAQKLRLDLQDAVEVEGVAAEHLRQRDRATFGLVHLGVGIDAADARLDLGELVGLHQVGLVEQDDVGEGDLVLGLRRVLEPLLQPLGEIGSGRVGKEGRSGGGAC